MRILFYLDRVSVDSVQVIGQDQLDLDHLGNRSCKQFPDLLDFMVEMKWSGVDLRLPAEREYALNQVSTIHGSLIYLLKIRVRRVLFVLCRQEAVRKIPARW